MVVVLEELANEVIQVPRAEDQEMIEAFVLQGLDEPLHMGVEVRRPYLQSHGLDAMGPESGSELRPEVGIPVVHDNGGSTGAISTRRSEPGRLPPSPGTGGMEGAL